MLVFFVYICGDTHSKDSIQMLSSTELSLAQNIINATPKGLFSLSQIYGSHWKNIPSPKSFGIRFKASVRAGQLRNIKIVERDIQNHTIYEIF